MWSKEPISFLKMCIFNFKFDLGLKILELEIRQFSQPADNSKSQEPKISSLNARLRKIDSMIDITETKRKKLEIKVRKYDRDKKFEKIKKIVSGQ